MIYRLFYRNDPNCLDDVDIRNIHPSLIEADNRKLENINDEKRRSLVDANYQFSVPENDSVSRTNPHKSPSSANSSFLRSK